MRVEHCVCGGILSASSKDGIPAVVRDHNRSLLHMVWRSAREAREWLEREKRGDLR